MGFFQQRLSDVYSRSRDSFYVSMSWLPLSGLISIVGNQYSQTHHPCLYLVLQNNNFLNKQTLSPADFRRILKLSPSMCSGILDTRSKLSSWQLQLSLTGQHCPECIDWGSLRSGQFSLSQKFNLHPAQQLVLKIIIFIPKTTICQFLSPVEPSTKPSWSSVILEK